MDSDFEKLLNEAKKNASKRILTEYADCGQVATAILTTKGNIYTGINSNITCSLGNCAEYAAVLEMLKNNETEIAKILTYTAKGKIYSPCGRCRELLRMINEKNLNCQVMVDENKVVLLKDLLPDIFEKI